MEIREIFEAALKLEADASEYVLGKLRFSFARGDKKNNNGRIYPSAVLKREVERMNSQIQQEPLAGELEHNFQGLIKLDRVSHIITSMEWDDTTKLATAEAKILKTTKGSDLMVLLRSGVSLGSSMYGHGEVGKFGMVQDEYKISGLDLVSSPSFGADAKVTADNLLESANSILERDENEKREQKQKEQRKKDRLATLVFEAKAAGAEKPIEYAKKILAESEKLQKELAVAKQLAEQEKGKEQKKGSGESWQLIEARLNKLLDKFDL